ncbi:MAG: ATP-grasp domain-containing protein, partial [Planctomycetes bacterium]|nr:ATP-grasp domain-containing protein [Planctomycetota bacterium]
MHALFLAPDTHIYNHCFVRALKSLGIRVSAIGTASVGQLSAPVRKLLDGYRRCPSPLDQAAMRKAADELASPGFDRVETIDEPLVESAAMLRHHFGLPGLSVETARLCRDKVAMKEFLRQRGIACARSGAVHDIAEAHAFAEREGYPLILKPVAGFGSLATYRVGDRAELDAALAKLKPSAGRPIAIEEFIEGHEGFYDTICDDRGIRHDFVSHYYPGCLEATRNRSVSPQIAVTNRIEDGGYGELRAMGKAVIEALGIRHAATHMEWFFGPKGLKFSEIGARPAGEMIWDMYRVANDFDVYREWALAILDRPSEQRPSRRCAAGSVQIRPDRDGRYAGHRGLQEAMRTFEKDIYDMAIPKPGTPTKPLDKGWLVNTW